MNSPVVAAAVCSLCKARPPALLLWRMCRCTHLKMHKACLEMKLQAAGEDSCMWCGRLYLVEKTPRYSPREAYRVWLGRHYNVAEVWLPTMLMALCGAELVLYVLLLAAGALPAWFGVLAAVAIPAKMAAAAPLLVRDHFAFQRWHRRTTHVRLLSPPLQHMED